MVTDRDAGPTSSYSDFSFRAPPVPARVLELQGLKERFEPLRAQVETVKAYVRSAAA